LGEAQDSRTQGRVASVGAVIVAAGQSRRMSGLDKTFAPLLGRPLILHTLDPFLACWAIGPIVLVLAESNIGKGMALKEEGAIPQRVSLCLGGPRRQDSAKMGLMGLGDCDWVAVHDGARPCLDVSLLELAIGEAMKHGNAVLATPVTDTIKMADGSGFIASTPPRNALWAVQTPQVFPLSVLRRAYERQEGDATDDASLVEKLGVRVKLVEGSYDNIKVTSPQDLAFAELIISRQKGSHGASLRS